jgi:hypothetical protein
MPLFNPTRKPAVPNSGLNIEPIYMTIIASPPRGDDEGKECLITWYAGQIPEDAVSNSYHLLVGEWLADRPV